jgi:hypothetical protein
MASGLTHCAFSLHAPRFFGVGVDATQRRQAAFKHANLLTPVTQLSLQFSVLLRRVLLNQPHGGIALLNQARAGCLLVRCPSVRGVGPHFLVRRAAGVLVWRQLLLPVTTSRLPMAQGIQHSINYKLRNIRYKLTMPAQLCPNSALNCRQYTCQTPFLSRKTVKQLPYYSALPCCH